MSLFSNARSPSRRGFLATLIRSTLALGGGLIFGSAAKAGSRTGPLGMMLSWDDDPTSTMVIDWHVGPRSNSRTVEVRRRGGNTWIVHEADTFPFPFSDRRVNRVKLSGLMPDTEYDFRFDCGRSWYFRTMPKTATRPIRFANGGDANATEATRRTNRTAAMHDIDFVLIGGDIAYANGDPRRIDRWYEWFEGVMDDLVTSDGRAIPMLVAIGNHEVFSAHRRGEEDARDMERKFGLKTGDARFYYELFPMAKKQGGYHTLDFGDYLSLVTLDSNHTNPVKGAQTKWLDEALAARRDVPFVFPVYHVPGWPSVRRFEGTTSVEIRENWVPLFERENIKLAFEHHDHIYKRSYPLRNGTVDADGVVYIGDGAWGVNPRPIGRDQNEEQQKAWYLREAKSINHYVLVELYQGRSSVTAIDNEGRLIDYYETLSRPRA